MNINFILDIRFPLTLKEKGWGKASFSAQTQEFNEVSIFLCTKNILMQITHIVL